MENVNDFKWLGKDLGLCGVDELVKCLQYYEVTCSAGRRNNRKLIETVRELLVEKMKSGNGCGC